MGFSSLEMGVLESKKTEEAGSDMHLRGTCCKLSTPYMYGIIKHDS
jgi:hypothetical protein